MATWPTSLPDYPLIDGYAEKPQDQTIRTQMEAGPDKVRRRFTAGVREFSVKWTLTTAQVSTLDTFFHSTLDGGALQFDMTHPRTGASTSFRFVGPYELASADKGLYDITATIEVLP